MYLVRFKKGRVVILPKYFNPATFVHLSQVTKCRNFLSLYVLFHFHFQLTFTCILLEYMYMGATNLLYLLFGDQLQPALWSEGFLIIY